MHIAHGHGAHVLVHLQQAVLEGEDICMIVIQDGDSDQQQHNQSPLEPLATIRVEHALYTPDVQVQQLHKEMLVFPKDVLIDDANVQLFLCLTSL